MYIERFEYFCPNCKQKGIVTDVLLNPELMIIRGRCSACGLQGSYKVVDMSAMNAEYEVLSELEKRGNEEHRGTEATWSVLRFKIKGA